MVHFIDTSFLAVDFGWYELRETVMDVMYEQRRREEKNGGLDFAQFLSVPT